MGWEYGIVLTDTSKYNDAIDMLYQAFSRSFGMYEMIKDETGFGLFCDNPNWPEIMQISIDTANHLTYLISARDTYIYCLFHLGGNEAYLMIECIKNTLDTLKLSYSMNDL